MTKDQEWLARQIVCREIAMMLHYPRTGKEVKQEYHAGLIEDSRELLEEFDEYTKIVHAEISESFPGSVSLN